MKWMFRTSVLRSLALSLFGIVLPLQAASADDKTSVAPGTPVTITVTQGTPPAPPVSINLLERHGHVTPCKGKHDHTGGGLIDVSSPSADTVVITMTGVAVANSEFKFDLDQCLEVSFDDPKVKKAKIAIEGRVVGLLRGEKKGSAEFADAMAHLSAGHTSVVSISLPPHSVCDCESLSVNDHQGPVSLSVTAGKYELHQSFRIAANSTARLGKKSSAEFSPDPALDPLWISYWEPFHGVKKDSFGFQVTLKVSDDTGTAADEKKPEEKKPEEAPAPAPAPKEEAK